MHMLGNHVVGKPATQIFLYLLFVELFLLYDEMQFALVVVVVFGNDDYTAFTVEKVFYRMLPAAAPVQQRRTERRSGAQRRS